MNLNQVRYLCDKSFYHFVRIIGGSVNQGRDIIKEVHKPFCDAWQDPLNKRIGAGMARGQRKTVVLTGWDTIYTYLQDQEERQLIATEKERLGMDILKWIKLQLMQNRLLKKVYEDKLKWIDNMWTKNNSWKATAIELPKKGLYTSPSVQVLGIRGAAQGGHFMTIHLDDIIGQAAIESPDVIMVDAFDWIDNLTELLVEPDYEKLNGSRVKITGSPWGAGDIYDYIRKKFPEYKWLVSPCQKNVNLKDKENFKWIQNPNVSHGESNFPLFPTSYYEDLKIKKPFVYWTQHACQPEEATSLHKFDSRWLKYFRFDERDKGLYLICLDDKMEDTEEIFPLSDIKLYGIIDPGAFAEEKSKRGSRNALLIGGQARDSYKKFVVYTEANRIKEPEKFIDVIFAADKEWRPRKWEIETVAAQNYIYEDIKEARRRRGTHISISPLDRDVSKDVKKAEIQALINPFFNGEIYINQGMKDFISEYKDYPGGLTNDLIDCLGKLFKYHMSRKEKRGDERPKHVMEDTQAGRSLVGGY